MVFYYSQTYFIFFFPHNSLFHSHSQEGLRKGEEDVLARLHPEEEDERKGHKNIGR